MSIRMINAVWQQSHQKGNALLLLQAIADFADDEGYAFPAVLTLAKKARVSERTAQTLIQKLRDDGELEVHAGAGPRGTNRYRVVIPEAHQMALLTPKSPAGGAAPLTGAAARTPQPSAPEPSVPLATQNEVRDGLGATDRGGAASAPPRLSPASEAKRIEKAATELWKSVRRAKFGARARYLDKGSYDGIRIAVDRALDASCTWLDIAAAVREHAPDPQTGSPWYLDEWAREAKAKREDQEQAERAREADRRADLERRTRVDAEWADLRERYPGRTTAEIVEIEIAAQRRRGGLKPIAVLITPLDDAASAQEGQAAS